MVVVYQTRPPREAIRSLRRGRIAPLARSVRRWPDGLIFDVGARIFTDPDGAATA